MGDEVYVGEARWIAMNVCIGRSMHAGQHSSCIGWEMGCHIRNFGCRIGKRCVLLVGIDGVADDEQLPSMGRRAVHRTLSMRRSEKAHRGKMGNSDIFDPVVA